NPGLIFGLLELLLGGNGKATLEVQRKLTEIETFLIQMLLRVILRDLSEAWKGVADIRFSAQSVVSEPAAVSVMAPTEAVVAVAIEVRIGSGSGVMNLAIPSIFIKRLRHKFDQLREIRRAESTVADQMHLGQLIQDTRVVLEACVLQQNISAGALLALNPGDLLLLDHPMERPVEALLNGSPKWLGNIVIAGEKLAFALDRSQVRRAD